MRILITGSGGREHALAWRLSQDEGKENIFIATIAYFYLRIICKQKQEQLYILLQSEEMCFAD